MLLTLIKMSGLRKKDQEAELKQVEMNDDPVGKNYATVSLFCLTVTNPFRDLVMKIVFKK